MDLFARALMVDLKFEQWAVAFEAMTFGDRIHPGARLELRSNVGIGADAAEHRVVVQARVRVLPAGSRNGKVVVQRAMPDDRRSVRRDRPLQAIDCSQRDIDGERLCPTQRSLLWIRFA